MKTTMPDAQTIYDRLYNELPEGSDVERFYRAFANAVGGRELNEQGFYLKWQLELHPFTTNPMGVPFFAALIMMNFEEYVTALFTDNPEFGQAVMAWHEVVNSRMEQGK